MQVIDGPWSYWIGGNITTENCLGNITVIQYNCYDSFNNNFSTHIRKCWVYSNFISLSNEADLS